MHIRKYDNDYTRRHFLRTLGQGVVTAGVLAPLADVVAFSGDISEAYPDEALSVEHYSKGAVKIGNVIDAGNVDSVKDLLEPITYWQIKNDGRIVDVYPTATDIMHLNPKPYIEATLSNRGRARFDENGNVVTDDGSPWIGGHPFPDARTAKEMMAGVAMSWGRHDVAFYCVVERELDSDGRELYRYEAIQTEVHPTGRLVLDPKPTWPGHENKLRYNSTLLTSPNNVSGSVFLNTWHYDQRRLPELHAYLSTFKRVRRLPTNQRFEPQLPGTVYFVSDAWTMGDPFLTWGNFNIVGKGPFLGAVGGQGGGWNNDRPNWEPPVVGGENGRKYYRTGLSLVPEAHIIEMEPIKYPRAPYSKRRVWIDARTMTPMASLAFDRAGKPWKQFEFGTALYEKPSGEHFAVGGETYWSWTHLHIHDFQKDRLSAACQLKKNNRGYVTTFNDPDVYDSFCTMQALRRLGV